MDKASKAFRRSTIRLRSAGSGHTDLQLVISELKETREAMKWFQSSQSSAVEDLLKWSLKGENRAIQETMAQLVELNTLWTDVLANFSENLKEYRHNFELILEGEKQVDQAKTLLTAAELKEAKLRKELKKTAKKGTSDEIQHLQSKLREAETARDTAQNEVTERSRENEAIKLIRLKQGLLRLSESYLEMAHKCVSVFEAHRDVAHSLPDVEDSEIHQIKYRGSGVARQAVSRAKSRVQSYTESPNEVHSEDPPPPYNPHFVSAAHQRSITYPSSDPRSVYYPSIGRQRADGTAYPGAPPPTPPVEAHYGWTGDPRINDLTSAVGGARIRT